MTTSALSSGFLKRSVFNWFVSRGYAQGVFWALMICLVSSTNDVLMRFLGERLHVVEIMFFRFLFSTLSVLPLMLNHEESLFKTKQPKTHVLRAIVGALALGLCCFSVNIMDLAQNTAIMFCGPLSFLPMAYFLLKEKVDKILEEGWEILFINKNHPYI